MGLFMASLLPGITVANCSMHCLAIFVPKGWRGPGNSAGGWHYTHESRVVFCPRRSDFETWSEEGTIHRIVIAVTAIESL